MDKVLVRRVKKSLTGYFVYEYILAPGTTRPTPKHRHNPASLLQSLPLKPPTSISTPTTSTSTPLGSDHSVLCLLLTLLSLCCLPKIVPYAGRTRQTAVNIAMLRQKDLKCERERVRHRESDRVAFKLEEDFVGGCMTMSMYSTTDKMKMSAPSCFPGRYSPSYRSSEQMRRCMPNPSGDIFAGINDGILSRAEALAAVDIQKHQAQHVHSQMPSQIKHDVMYHHHTMSGPPQRPLQSYFSSRRTEDRALWGGVVCPESSVGWGGG
ncbi:hypothetical protein ACLKA7_011796 [Drosophila subpalustris]